MSDPGRHDPNALVHHEEAEIPTRTIFYWIGGFVVFAIVTHFLVSMMYDKLRDLERAKKEAPITMVQTATPAVPPEPRLQPFATAPQSELRHTPAHDMEVFRRGEIQTLSSYGWVDRGQGVVRIPIDRAMDLTLERGLPSREAPVPPPAEPKPVDPVLSESQPVVEVHP